jgi:hypothetical protein
VRTRHDPLAHQITAPFFRAARPFDEDVSVRGALFRATEGVYIVELPDLDGYLPSDTYVGDQDDRNGTAAYDAGHDVPSALSPL